MKYTNQRINELTMGLIYGIMFVTSLLGLLVAPEHDFTTVIPQLSSLVISVVFILILMNRGLSKTTHIVSVTYYMAIVFSLAYFLGISHSLSVIYFVFSLIIIINTIKNPLKSYFLGSFIGLYIILGILQLFTQNDNEAFIELAVGGLLGHVVLSLGLAFILLMTRYFLDGLMNQIQQTTLFDPLTDCKNRRAYIDDIIVFESDYDRYATNYTLSYMDMDNFKEINDKFGHIVGDELLILLSEKIKDNIRPGDGIYRFGGDEFVLIMRNINFGTTKVKLERILSELYESNTLPVEVSFSYGIVDRKESRLAKDDMLAKADELMYEAKQKKQKLHNKK